jgi:hypothetical protein
VSKITHAIMEAHALVICQVLEIHLVTVHMVIRELIVNIVYIFLSDKNQKSFSLKINKLNNIV